MAVLSSFFLVSLFRIYINLNLNSYFYGVILYFNLILPYIYDCEFLSHTFECHIYVYSKDTWLPLLNLALMCGLLFVGNVCV